MSFLTLLAIFAMIWWVTLFMVLPLWNVSHHEADVKLNDGGDPGAPLKTNLKKKLLINTYLAFGIWVIFIIITKLHLISL